MSETKYAFVDTNGVVTNLIVADKAFIDALPKQIADPNVDTGDIIFSKVVDVTDKDVNIGYIQQSNGSFKAPVPPPPTQEQLDAIAAAEAETAQREADTTRLAELRKKVGPLNPGLTQDERDELNVLMLSQQLPSV